MSKCRALPICAFLCVLLTAPSASAANYRQASDANAPASLQLMAQSQLKAHPGDAEAEAWLARALYRQGKFQAAQTAIQHSNGLPKLLAQGDYDLFIGQYEAAAKAFEAARAMAPKDVDARLGLASAEVETNQYDKAYDLAKATEGAARAAGGTQLSRSLVIQGGALGLKANLGNLFDKIRFGPRVQKVLAKAVALAPNFPHAEYALGRYYLEAPGVVGGDPNKAVSTLALAVHLDPYFFLADAWYIRALKKTGQHARAAAEIASYQHKFAGLSAPTHELAGI